MTGLVELELAVDAVAKVSRPLLEPVTVTCERQVRLE